MPISTKRRVDSPSAVVQHIANTAIPAKPPAVASPPKVLEKSNDAAVEGVAPKTANVAQPKESGKVPAPARDISKTLTSAKATKSKAKASAVKAASPSADLSVVADANATGAALITEMIKEPSLDVFIDRHPDTMKPEDFKKVVDILRGDRTRFQTKQDKKKEAKEDANAA